MQDGKKNKTYQLENQNTKLILGKAFLSKGNLELGKELCTPQAPNTVTMKVSGNSCWNNFKIKCHVQSTECVSGK